MKCDKIRALIPEYLDGELDAQAEETVRLHVAECPDCDRELDEMGRMLSLVRGLGQVDPPPDLLARIRGRLVEERPRRLSLAGILSLPQARVALAASVLMALGVYGYMERVSNESHRTATISSESAKNARTGEMEPGRPRPGNRPEVGPAPKLPNDSGRAAKSVQQPEPVRAQAPVVNEIIAHKPADKPFSDRAENVPLSAVRKESASGAAQTTLAPGAQDKYAGTPATGAREAKYKHAAAPVARNVAPPPPSTTPAGGASVEQESARRIGSGRAANATATEAPEARLPEKPGVSVGGDKERTGPGRRDISLDAGDASADTSKIWRKAEAPKPTPSAADESQAADALTQMPLPETPAKAKALAAREPRGKRPKAVAEGAPADDMKMAEAEKLDGAVHAIGTPVQADAETKQIVASVPAATHPRPVVSAPTPTQAAKKSAAATASDGLRRGTTEPFTVTVASSDPAAVRKLVERYDATLVKSDARSRAADPRNYSRPSGTAEPRALADADATDPSAQEGGLKKVDLAKAGKATDKDAAATASVLDPQVAGEDGGKAETAKRRKDGQAQAPVEFTVCVSADRYADFVAEMRKLGAVTSTATFGYAGGAGTGGKEVAAMKPVRAQTESAASELLTVKVVVIAPLSVSDPPVMPASMPEK